MIGNSSVRIDVEQLLQEREAEKLKSSPFEAVDANEPTKLPTKRKATTDNSPKAKKVKTIAPAASAAKVTLKLGPQPIDSTPFPCCLCISQNKAGLLRVVDPPVVDKVHTGGGECGWMAHEECAGVVPETWVDEIEVYGSAGEKRMEKVIYGVDGIVKDRWNLVCVFLLYFDTHIYVLNHLPFRNARIARNREISSMGRRSSARKENVQRLSTYRAQRKVGRVE
jgi:hypothetical protein